MEHEKYISGWALSVMPTVWDDVVENMTGIHREYIGVLLQNCMNLPVPTRALTLRVKPLVISCRCSIWSSRIFSTI